MALLSAWRGILLCILLASSSVVRAQDPASGFRFLTIGGGARAVGLAETMVADGEDPFVVEYNPAGLAALEGFTVAFSHNQFFQDTRGEYVSVGVPTGQWAFGARMGYVGTEDIPFRTGPSEQPLAFFDASNGVLQGALARLISERLSLGVSAAYVLGRMSLENAQGAVFGIGMRYQRSDRLTLGASLINIGPQTSFKERKFKMPNRFYLGGIWRHALLSLRGELVAPDNENAKWRFGVEATPDPHLSLRAGLKLGYDTQVFAAGFGVRTPGGRFGVDYAFAPYRYDLGNTHRFGLSIRP